MRNELTLSQSTIENRIFTVRNLQVMLDFHLAELFEVETKRLNEQVKRNNKRFPENFMFQLSKQEWEDMQSQIATAKRRTIPYIFTEKTIRLQTKLFNKNKVACKDSLLTTLYGKLSLHKFDKAHDRFLILDRTKIYHIGASLKNLGKKWFAFSKMDKSSVSQLLNSILEML